MISREEVTVREAEAAHQIVQRKPAPRVVYGDVRTDVDVPAELDDRAHRFMQGFERFLLDRTERYVDRVQAERDSPEVGGPVLPGGYQYWNVLTVGPLQLVGPNFAPQKIIAAGQPSLMLGVIWINPAAGPGGSLPGTTVLGARTYRAVFDAWNVSDVTNGPDATYTTTFTSPAPVLTLLPWWFVPADPGARPNIYECTLTCDILQGGQPFAAFSTWHLDPDTEPGFLGRPTMGPHYSHNVPARYLVYRE